MPKPEQPIAPAQPQFFELVKDTGKTVDVVVKAAKGKDAAITEKRPVLLTGDEAMVIALEKAEKMGFAYISMQQEDAERFLFLAYNR